MTAPADFEDRLAARLLGVSVDADPAEIRARFRRLARAVHPDTAVGVGCVDLGRLAEAKDRLVARAEAHEATSLRLRVERLRLTQDPTERVGLLVDLAG